MTVEFFPPSSRSAAERRRLCQEPIRLSQMSADYHRYGLDYFDNPALVVGYGAYRYDGRYAGAAAAMCRHYGLKPGDRVLEIGCAKGFFLVEFHKLGMQVAGMDASEYAVAQAHPEIRPFIRLGDAARLPFGDGTFDLVIGKEVLPHIPEARLRSAIRECMRVAKGPIFFEIQCGRTEWELEYMRLWDGTHQTMRSPAWWDALFAELGYAGDRHYKVLVPDEEER